MQLAGGRQDALGGHEGAVRGRRAYLAPYRGALAALRLISAQDFLRTDARPKNHPCSP